MHLQVDWFRTVERGVKSLGMYRGVNGNWRGANGSKEGIYQIQRGPLALDSGDPWIRHSDSDIGSALQLETPTNNTPWFGVGPEVSIIARDWGSAKSLLGGDIAVTDAIRPSHSFRMGLARVRLGSGRITPFAQFGAGAYRLDNDIVATRMRDTEVAAQIGGGIEAHILKSNKVEWDIAAESCLTQIVRNEREPQNVTMSRMVSGLIASRIRF